MAWRCFQKLGLSQNAILAFLFIPQVGYCFRDLLHDKYKSSSASKAAKRRLSKLGSGQAKTARPQDEQPKQPHRRVSVLGPVTSNETQQATASPEQAPSAEEVSVATVTESCQSPVPSTVQSVSSEDPMVCISTPTLSTDTAGSDCIPDLEPLPFDGDEIEPSVECADIILIDDEDEECQDTVAHVDCFPDENTSAILPTYTSSAMALMTTMKPHDSLLGTLRLSAASRSSVSLLRQPYKMATPTMNWMDFCQGVTNFP